MQTGSLPLKITLVILTLILPFAPAMAVPEGSQGFAATWSLLKADQKRQFIAGYIFGWREAAVITDVVADYIRKNPDSAVHSLEKIKSMYDLGDVNPFILSNELDAFFSDPDNSNATLAMAVNSARQRVIQSNQ
ncbi:MAG: hypothetical protein KDD53_04680 [Bdellovibrionales bacterium]|nr:hypothetical protein [Bdellovibrionales bacterium]